MLQARGVGRKAGFLLIDNYWKVTLQLICFIKSDDHRTPTRAYFLQNALNSLNLVMDRRT